MPDEAHRVLRVRAARQGLSLSEYLRREITALTERPTREEFLELASSQPATCDGRLARASGARCAVKLVP